MGGFPRRCDVSCQKKQRTIRKNKKSGPKTVPVKRHRRTKPKPCK